VLIAIATAAAIFGSEIVTSTPSARALCDGAVESQRALLPAVDDFDVKRVELVHCRAL